MAGVLLGHWPVFRQVPGQRGPVCPAGSGPVPRVNETEKTVHVFTTERDKQYPELRPLPRRQPRTAGHALAPPPLPPFLSWPGRCSADGMRQRLLERCFVPCWARMLRGAWPAPCGGERLSQGQGAPQSALASPKRRGPGPRLLLSPNPPTRRRSSGPPSPLQTYFLFGTELAPCLSPNGRLLCLENLSLFYLKSRAVPSSPW